MNCSKGLSFIVILLNFTHNVAGDFLALVAGKVHRLVMAIHLLISYCTMARCIALDVSSLSLVIQTYLPDEPSGVDTSLIQ